MANFPQLAETNINPLAPFYDAERQSLADNAQRTKNSLASDTYSDAVQGSHEDLLRAQLGNQGTQQLRALAPGLASGDPNAVAGAAVLPGGAAGLDALTNQRATQYKVDSAMPGLGPPVGGAPGGLAPPVGGGPSSALDDAYAGKMAQSESSGNPANVNAGGYSGSFQFGAPRLAELGLYQPASGEIGAGGKWNGKMAGQFNIPGFPAVKTQADFLASPNAQRAAFGAQVADIDTAIGNTPGAAQLDRTGLQAVAHLGGVAGMQKFVATGGQYDPGDNPNAPGGGTHLSDYYKKFSGPGGLAAFQTAHGHPAGPLQPHEVQTASATPPAASQAVAQPVDAQAAPAPLSPEAAAHPGLPAAQTLANTVLAAPPEQRAAVYAQGLPEARANGAVDAPDAYPGDDTMTRLAAHQQTAPAPNVQYASRAPMPGDTMSDASPGGAAPPPAPGTQDAATVLARLRAQQVAPVSPSDDPSAGGVPAPAAPASQQTLASNGPGPAPAGASAQPAPQGNTLAAPPPAAAPPPPAAAVQPQQGPAPIGLPPPGARPMINRVTGLPFPGAAPGMAFYQLPDGTRQQFRDPSVPESLTMKDSGNQRNFYDPRGNLVRTEAIPGTGRETLVHPYGDGRTQMEKDGALIGPIFPADTREFSINLAKNDNEKVLPVLAQSALDQEQTLQKTIEARDAAAKVPTGAGFEGRAALSNWLTTYAPEVAAKVGVGTKGSLLPDPAKAAEAGKLLMSQAQQSEKAMGGSGGLGITKMFVDNNPNPNMQGTGIRDMSNLIAVTSMANKDYLQGKINHIDTQTTNIQTPGGGQYKPVSAFEKSWFSQNNTNTYYGAVQAMNGAPYEQWSKGLSDAEKQRALGVIARIDPASTVTGRNGHPLAVSGFKPSDPSNPSGVVASQ